MLEFKKMLEKEQIFEPNNKISESTVKEYDFQEWHWRTFNRFDDDFDI